MDNLKKTTRRNFLKLAAAGSGSAVLAACTPAQPTATVAPAETAAATALPTLTADGRIGHIPLTVWPTTKYDPIVEITQVGSLWPPGQFINNETLTDNVVSRWYKEMLGVQYKFIWEAREGFTEKWATTFASGELPEFLTYLPPPLRAQAFEADALEDITDIVESVASPLLKQKRGYPNGDIWNAVRRNGRLYGIPGTPGNRGQGHILWVRQDWLDKVNMKVPTTVEEMYEVGKAFLAAGLGEMGLIVAGSPHLVWNWQASIDPIFGAFGGMPAIWHKQDGKLVYGSTLPEVKLGLAELRKWYADKLIDPDFANRDPSAGAGAIGANKGGMMFGIFWVPCCGIKDSQTNDPEANWVYADIPAGPTGIRKRWESQLVGTEYQGLFKKGTDPKKIAAVIEHYNFDHALHDASTVGARYYFEGYDYVIEGGVPKAGPAPYGTRPYEGGPGHGTFSYGSDFIEELFKIVELRKQDKSKLTPLEVYKTSDLSAVLQDEAHLFTYDGWEERAMIDEFWGTPTKTMVEAWAQLQKVEDQAFLGIITGQQPLDAFDQFVKDWSAQGGAKVTEEVNQWYSENS